jgi:hypothetical protein
MAQADVTKPSGGLKILNASLFRMDIKSMAKVYQILGFTIFYILDNFINIK